MKNECRNNEDKGEESSADYDEIDNYVLLPFFTFLI